jgi:hypothetical protein
MNSPLANPVTRADVLVLLVVLARYEGSVRGGEVDDHNVQRLWRRCVDAGLLPESATAPDRDQVAQVLDDIGQRLRYALGEYPQDPTLDR